MASSIRDHQPSPLSPSSTTAAAAATTPLSLPPHPCHHHHSSSHYTKGCVGVRPGCVCFAGLTAARKGAFGFATLKVKSLISHEPLIAIVVSAVVVERSIGVSDNPHLSLGTSR
ncbi:hypothetical protein Tco_0710748 [Tanacetum coccineum]